MEPGKPEDIVPKEILENIIVPPRVYVGVKLSELDGVASVLGFARLDEETYRETVDSWPAQNRSEILLRRHQSLSESSLTNRSMDRMGLRRIELRPPRV